MIKDVFARFADEFDRSAKREVDFAKEYAAAQFNKQLSERAWQAENRLQDQYLSYTKPLNLMSLEQKEALQPGMVAANKLSSDTILENTANPDFRAAYRDKSLYPMLLAGDTAREGYGVLRGTPGAIAMSGAAEGLSRAAAAYGHQEVMAHMMNDPDMMAKIYGGNASEYTKNGALWMRDGKPVYPSDLAIRASLISGAGLGGKNPMVVINPAGQVGSSQPGALDANYRPRRTPGDESSGAGANPMNEMDKGAGVTPVDGLNARRDRLLAELEALRKNMETIKTKGKLTDQDIETYTRERQRIMNEARQIDAEEARQKQQINFRRYEIEQQNKQAEVERARAQMRGG